jgi:hypothetical protein
MSPAQLGEHIRNELDYWGKVMKNAQAAPSWTAVLNGAASDLPLHGVRPATELRVRRNALRWARKRSRAHKREQIS